MRPPAGPGAEVEASRGCPYHCTFCAKENFRNLFRRRPATVIAEELDGLVEAGIEYVYFIDEIFLPDRDVVEAIGARQVKFGIQTRIDLWSSEMLDLLGEAGCVSIEAGVESITEEGRSRLDKKCRISTDEITEKLIHAKQRVPFVQANLMNSQDDDPEDVEHWRQRLREHGVWANQPVPMFSYPGSPDYVNRWGRRTTVPGSGHTNRTCEASRSSAISRSSGRRRWCSWSGARDERGERTYDGPDDR